MSGMVPREWLDGLPEVDGEPESAKKRKASPGEDGDYLQMFDSQEASTSGSSTTPKTTSGKETKWKQK